MKQTNVNPWAKLKDLYGAWRSQSRTALFAFLGEMVAVADGMKFAEFVAMAEAELGWSHSVAARWLRVGRWVRDVKAAAPELIDQMPTEVGHLDELQRVSAERLGTFAKMFPLVFSDEGVSRPELSRLVDEFLDMKRTRRQLDFFDRLNFPDLDKIRAAAVDGEFTIDAGKAGDYGVTMLTLAVHKADGLAPEKREELVGAISTLLAEFCGNDPAKVIDAIHQASK